MGQSHKILVRCRGQTFESQVDLEADFIRVRPPFLAAARDWRWTFSRMTQVEVDDGWLILELSGERIELQLGRRASDWQHKILHPKSPFEKLGLKPRSSHYFDGNIPNNFLEFVANLGIALGPIPADTTVLYVSSPADLTRISPLSEGIRAPRAIWIVHPKGKYPDKSITYETSVRNIARATGLIDVKVVAFSTSHSALRFIRTQSGAPGGEDVGVNPRP